MSMLVVMLRAGRFAYDRVEQAAGDAVKRPDIGHQAHAKCQGNEYDVSCIGEGDVTAGRRGGGRSGGDLGASKGEKEKQECPDKLAQGGHNIVAYS